MSVCHPRRRPKSCRRCITELQVRRAGVGDGGVFTSAAARAGGSCTGLDAGVVEPAVRLQVVVVETSDSLASDRFQGNCKG